MKKYSIFCAALLSAFAMFFFTACQSTRSVSTDVTEVGAVGDGVTLNTKALQAAIDACPKGGVVLVPAGQYVTGTLWLKSDMELRLAEGAVLLGSTNIDDYSRDNQGAIEAPAFDECLIYAENAKNVSITGGGVIDGRGTKEHFPIGDRKAYNDRPMLIRFVDCDGVTFENVSFMNAASWCTHLVNCDNVVARNVTIDSQVNRNNDGFDLDGCKNVLIEDCDIRTGDDSICPKSTTERLCENIVVRNCRITSHTSAFKCGTSSRGGFKNLHVYDCEFYDVGMGAIKLQIVDGGMMEDVLIEDIKITGSEGPLFVRLGSRGREYDKPTEQIQGKDAKPEGVPTGSMKGITIRNITAEVVTEDRKRSGIMITGVPDHYIEDVLLENITISYPGGGTAEEAKNVVDEDIARYPEQFFFGVLPSWGAYIRHAKNVEFKNVNMYTRAPDARQRLVLEDVVDFKE
ncbi:MULTISPECIES: glycoside hydrolase family 28 protein [unclassified Lentimonas]|uniref:glycoside hydrolase family 28 protein n=1 Tax=unclassified Lentimonas TaxID=2630993 RepID=UPI00132305CE|nr:MULTISPECIES: glycoside hydrolase family 28 protein [unclassified Lentimonas]CAA6677652.1 Polygalacturonase (EC [Lentimonas sp. CC4]CAA6684915.1 Polygalacturonase (EC [Lentimonas sp. CC6]CAA7077972.1 Polygalacturonase (EC [Lentimonas sp. CC4]CAA7169893.1 Polygalacturonase (EC [Lentimonas sp. CC21]CAA7181451.1 Polygalacturonase (EC [Lentimonas sp. CC8]